MKASLTRRQFTRQAASAGLLLGSAQASGARPNVVVLLTDDQRWDSLGCMGNPIIRTPHIDRLSQRGVTFENHFVTTSICMTSRASIFSGLYARAHQINDFEKPFTEQQFSRIYPEMMRQTGYHTGFIGKYGVGGAKVMPAGRFDYWRGFPGQGHYYQKRPDGSFIHLTELMGDQALEFLRGAPASKPFCLSISFKAPHVQDEHPQQFLFDPAHADWYKDVRIPPPKKADPKYVSMLPIEAHRSENRRRWAVRFSTPELYQESAKGYYRLITEVDDVVGRIQAELERMGAASNTVILYTGDNGFYLGERGLAGKWFMHEESIRTPLIVHDPRLPRSVWGSRRRNMSLSIDIAPTLIQAAGLTPHPSTQGRNLYPLLEGGSPPWRTEWFYEHNYEHPWIPQSEGVRTERWKYARYIHTAPPFEELYDLQNDPEEERSLTGEAAHRERLEAMRARWRTWRANLEAWRPDGAWKEPV